MVRGIFNILKTYWCLWKFAAVPNGRWGGEGIKLSIRLNRRFWDMELEFSWNHYCILSLPFFTLKTIFYHFNNHYYPKYIYFICNPYHSIMQIYKWSLYHNESFFQLNVSYVLGSWCKFWMSIRTSSSLFHPSLSSVIQSGWIT